MVEFAMSGGVIMAAPPFCLMLFKTIISLLGPLPFITAGEGPCLMQGYLHMISDDIVQQSSASIIDINPGGVEIVRVPGI